jgi:DNA polymerase
VKPKAPGAFCEKCPLQDAPFVPPYGPKHPAFIVVGEGPGREEVKAGQPFVGRSGKLLREVLLAADLDPNTGYFTNVVLCHPPDNRKPETEEVSCCAPRLAKELAAIPEAPILAVVVPHPRA